MDDQNSAYDAGIAQYFDDFQRNENSAMLECISKAMCDAEGDLPADTPVQWYDQPHIGQREVQGFNLGLGRENDVIEPEEFRYNPPDYLLFEDSAQRNFNRYNDAGFRDESKMDHEEHFRSTNTNLGAGKTVKAHTK